MPWWSQSKNLLMANCYRQMRTNPISLPATQKPVILRDLSTIVQGDVNNHEKFNSFHHFLFHSRLLLIFFVRISDVLLASCMSISPGIDCLVVVVTWRCYSSRLTKCCPWLTITTKGLVHFLLDSYSPNPKAIKGSTLEVGEALASALLVKSSWKLIHLLLKVTEITVKLSIINKIISNNFQVV